MQKLLSFMLVFGAALLSLVAAAKSELVGSRTVILTDPSRGGRTIPVMVYYPALTSGSVAAFSASSRDYPFIVFGHGYGIAVSAYEPLCTKLVSAGFIMVMPLTEVDSDINPARLAADMRAVFSAMQLMDKSDTSFLYRRIGRGAMAGHSMGGGGSIIAAAGNQAVTCIFNLAAATIKPSPIAAATDVHVPLLMLAGEKDCATPYKTTQLLIYQNASSLSKTLVVLKGADHCQFAIPNKPCQSIESDCGVLPSLSQAAQLTRTTDLLIPFLRWQLNGDSDAERHYKALIRGKDFYSNVYSTLLQ